MSENDAVLKRTSSFSHVSPLILGVVLLTGYFAVAWNMGYFVDPELNYHAHYNHQIIGEIRRPHDRDFARIYLLGNLWKLTLLLPATVCLTGALSYRISQDRWKRWLEAGKSVFIPRILLPAVFILAFILLFLRLGVLDSKFVYDDETSYNFQAQVLGTGHLFVKVPPVFDAVFQHPLVYVKNGQWMSQYTTGHPFLLMLGLKMGSAWIVPFLMALCIPFFIYLIGREVFSVRTSVLAALLLLISPLFLWCAATIMNHVSTLFFLSLFFLGYLRSQSNESVAWSILAGLALGIALYIRPQTAVGFGAPFALLSLYTIVRSRNKSDWFRPIIMLLSFCVPLMWFLLSNKLITGDWFVSSYTFNGSNKLTGFGGRADYTPAHAVVNMMRNFQRNNLWLFGWPFSLIFVFSRFLRGGFQRKELILYFPIIGLAAIFTLFPAAGVMELGGRYYFCMLPSLLLISAAEIVDLHHLFSAKSICSGRAIIPVFVGLSTVLGGVTFGVEKIQHFMNLSARSMQIKTTVEGNVETPAVVEVYSKIPSGWVFGNPIPDPEFKDSIIYLNHAPATDMINVLLWLEQKKGQPVNHYRSWYSPEDGATYLDKIPRETLEDLVAEEVVMDGEG